MLVLAIDTCTKIGTVALYDSEEGMVGEINLNAKQNHSDIIMTAVDSLFKLTKKDIKEVDKIAVSIGPGSFTGIRIGVGIAKGLAYSLEKPIVGINELDLIAHNIAKREEKIIAMLDARKERVFYSSYRYEGDELQRISQYLDGEIREILKEEKDKIVLVGDGATEYREIAKEMLGENVIVSGDAINIPRATILAELALEKEDNIFTLEPFYVNKSQAEREKERTSF